MNSWCLLFFKVDTCGAPPHQLMSNPAHQWCTVVWDRINSAPLRYILCDIVTEIPIEMLWRLLFVLVSATGPWACCSQRVKAGCRPGARHGCLWSPVPTVRAVTAADCPTYNGRWHRRAVLSLTGALYQHCSPLGFTVRHRIFTSRLSWVKFVGASLEESGGPDLSHVSLTPRNFRENY